ncbi:MAG: hypothetical protein N2Z72_03515 [Bacteroidales bacterium]|nr:hypothetical protein [Bacteroidales bacterium]
MSTKKEDVYPSYLKLFQNGELKRRAEELWNRMKQCDLCPRNCRVNRLDDQRGFCKASSTLKIASFGPHFGEEKELVGTGGSGTIFFSHCSMLCVFCFNHEISHLDQGEVTTCDGLAKIMLHLQEIGCSNINLVTPTHYIPHILKAILIAVQGGLILPLVYNSSGYEKVEILKYLDGIVDIYLPDFKFGCNEYAGKYAGGAYDYVEVTQRAILEMNRQVGVLEVDQKTRIAKRGLMIRHLVMPNNVSCSDKVIEWIAQNLPRETYINIMSQYHPSFKAKNFPEISRKISHSEFEEVIKHAKKQGLINAKPQE